MSDKTKEGEWVAVGAIARAHGLRGSLIVKSFTRTVDDFLEAPLKRVFFRRKGEAPVPQVITHMAAHKDMPMITLEGIDDRTSAEKWLGAEILIPESERWELDDGEYYADDLVGLMLVEEGTNRELGKVLRVDVGPAHDYLIFNHPDKPGKEVLLPFVPDFTPEVNFDEERIVVRIPDGLLEL